MRRPFHAVTIGLLVIGCGGRGFQVDFAADKSTYQPGEGITFTASNRGASRAHLTLCNPPLQVRRGDRWEDLAEPSGASACAGSLEVLEPGRFVRDTRAAPAVSQLSQCRARLRVEDGDGQEHFLESEPFTVAP